MWLSQKTPGVPKKLPWFEYFAREGWGEVSFMQELPYDYSILLENVVDPAHLPISHDGSHSSAMHKNAQASVSLKILIVICDLVILKKFVIREWCSWYIAASI